MTSSLSVAAKAITVLIVPGPTNTLLATSGALTGFRDAYRLVVAEALGYLTAITVLQHIAGPFLHAHSIAALAIRLICAGLLLAIALKLWLRPLSPGFGTISFRGLYMTTLLNPKAFIFAFSILPLDPSGLTRPFDLGLLVGFILMAGICWVALGSTLGARAPHAASRIRQAGAALLAVFAGLSLSSLLHV